MWAGIKLDDFEQSIYRNFYSKRDMELIRGIEDATLPQVRKLINKAYKIGDYSIAGVLEDMYDELLRSPPKEYPPLPPREELYAQYLQLMEDGWRRLASKHHMNTEEALTCFGQELNPFTFNIAKADMLIRGGGPRQYAVR